LRCVYVPDDSRPGCWLCLHATFFFMYASAALFFPLFFLPSPPPLSATLFPYTTLFRSPRRPISRDPARSLRPRQSACLAAVTARSEEHTSELQSPDHLVCRLLLEKKINKQASARWRRAVDVWVVAVRAGKPAGQRAAPA